MLSKCARTDIRRECTRLNLDLLASILSFLTCKEHCRIHGISGEWNAAGRLRSSWNRGPAETVDPKAVESLMARNYPSPRSMDVSLWPSPVVLVPEPWRTTIEEFRFAFRENHGTKTAKAIMNACPNLQRLVVLNDNEYTRRIDCWFSLVDAVDKRAPAHFQVIGGLVYAEGYMYRIEELEPMWAGLRVLRLETTTMRSTNGQFFSMLNRLAVLPRLEELGVPAQRDANAVDHGGTYERLIMALLANGINLQKFWMHLPGTFYLDANLATGVVVRYLHQLRTLYFVPTPKCPVDIGRIREWARKLESNWALVQRPYPAGYETIPAATSKCLNIVIPT